MNETLQNIQNRIAVILILALQGKEINEKNISEIEKSH